MAAKKQRPISKRRLSKEVGAVTDADVKNMTSGSLGKIRNRVNKSMNKRAGGLPHGTADMAPRKARPVSKRAKQSAVRDNVAKSTASGMLAKLRKRLKRYSK